jgi:hypothetical protein
MSKDKQPKGTAIVRNLWHICAASVIAIAIFTRLRNDQIDGSGEKTNGNGDPPKKRSKLRLVLAFIARYLLAIFIGIFSLFLAYRALYVSALAPDVLPAVAFVTWPQPINPDLRPYVSVDVSATPGYQTCDTVHVHAVFTPPPEFFNNGSTWAAYKQGGRPPVTHFAIGINDLTSPQNIKVRLDTSNSGATFTRSGKVVNEPYGAVKARRAIRVGQLEPSYGDHINIYALPGTIADWPVHRSPIVVDFDADWTAYHSIESCYVQLPSLTSDYVNIASSWASIVVENHAHVSSVDPSNPTSYGQTSIEVTNGISTLDPRSPTPDSPPGYSWSCMATLTGSGPDCNGLVIASRPNADNIRTFTAFISAALFSLALQMAYDKSRKS